VAARAIWHHRAMLESGARDPPHLLEAVHSRLRAVQRAAQVLGASFHFCFLLGHPSPIGHPLRKSVQSRRRNVVSSKAKNGFNCISCPPLGMSFAKTRTPPVRSEVTPRAESSGTLMYGFGATVGGLHLGNTWARQRFLTELPARQAHKTFGLGSISEPLLRFPALRSRAIVHRQAWQPSRHVVSLRAAATTPPVAAQLELPENRRRRFCLTMRIQAGWNFGNDTRSFIGRLVSSRHAEDFCLCAASSSLIFSRSRSVTSRRNREFSSWSSAIRSPPPRVR
jgi:hypothetical protein